MRVFKTFSCLLFLLMVFLLTACSQEPASKKLPQKTEPQKAIKEPEKIRPSALAGSWYPAEPDTLRQVVDNFLSTASRESYPKQKLFALVSPHAGYAYSGLAAAYGYNRLRGQEIERVIILAPSHHAPYRGVSIPDATHYETPLGKVPIDRVIAKKLLKYPLFSTVSEAHTEEHSLEIQLPMLQQTLSNFSLVPLVLGRVEMDQFQEIADAIKPFLSPKTLLVASSDFTHYGDRFDYTPFHDNHKAELSKLDGGALDRILAKDFEGFLKYKESTGATICGFVSIATLLKLLPENVQGSLLHYYTSGDLTGEYQNSVSYASVAFYEEKKGEDPSLGGEEAQSRSPKLNQREQETLLKIARNTLEEVVRFETIPRISLQHNDFSPKLMSERGVFVTLKIDGELRGCIGNIMGRGPLFLSTMRNAINSSLQDQRFQPVTEEELESIKMEISVLTPPQLVSGPEGFVVGKHGIILKKDGVDAVFLPQVAPEQGWDRETTLTHLAGKAGLPSDAWKKEAEFWVFEAQVFEEGKAVTSHE